MLKKLFIALVFSSATFVWSGSSFAGGHCVGTTMNDAQTGGKYPQQYELSAVSYTHLRAHETG